MSRLLGSSFKTFIAGKSGPTLRAADGFVRPRLDEHLEAVHKELQAGPVSAQSLVLLFRAASEAEERGDLAALDDALGLAREIARVANDALEPEAERLVALCEQSLERTRQETSAAQASRPVEGTVTCPECGRQLEESAVRCRACGFLYL